MRAHVFRGQNRKGGIDKDGEAARIANRVDIGSGAITVQKHQAVVGDAGTGYHQVEIGAYRAVAAAGGGYQSIPQDSRKTVNAWSRGLARIAAGHMEQVAGLP